MSRTCKEAECGFCKQVKKIASKGYCSACYSRLQKTGSLEYKRKGVINICTVENCGNRVVSHGLCDKHRVNLKRNGTAESTRPDDWGKREKHPLYIYWNDTKKRESLNICDGWKYDFWFFVSCVKERPSKNHYLRARYIDRPLSSDNWQWVEGLTDANRLILNRQKQRKHNKNRLRLSAEERDKIISDANHKCQICGADKNTNDCVVTGKKTTKSLCIDHCHETGKVRGVLCHSCNVALGHFKDDISLLKKATVYLSSNS